MKINTEQFAKLYKTESDKIDAVLNNLKRYLQSQIALKYSLMTTQKGRDYAVTTNRRFLTKTVSGILELNSISKKKFSIEIVGQYIPVADEELCRRFIKEFLYNLADAVM